MSSHSCAGLRNVLILVLCVACSACSNMFSRAADHNITAAAVLAAGSYIPTTSLEQIYYLGVFDPQEQLPPTIYRVRVRGQSSFINQTRYASGWVPAGVIDSLSSTAKFNSLKNDKSVTVDKNSTDEVQTRLTGRRLIMFGPEGFREAPKDHRLVIAMGASPEKFFSAVDEALGVVATVTQGNADPQLERNLFKELLRIKSERERLDDLRSEAKAEMTKE